MPCTDHDHTAPPALPTSEQQNLLPYIDKTSFKVLNGVFKPLGDVAAGAAYILEDPTGDKYLESDCDCQLLIQVHFLQPVKLYSLLVDTTNSEDTIKHIHLYKNVEGHGTNLTFDKIQATKFDFSIECRADGNTDLQEYHVPRPFFKNVKSLVLFIPDNLEEDEDLLSKINYLEFRGDPVHSSQYQAQEFSLRGQVFESAPNLNDHLKLDDGSSSKMLL
ncbi:hypothetical protein ACO0RG_003936 [Hanseniaspora osmophila]|uniref:PITH domain-containing protein n=1 Tax=Hanseniaspora osmophila TaxID=56408 RepID=A0A1E5RAI3_9ASCO|nr:hypothetical protein AWRI3579_g2572 [Hanseniaspora osmophila]